MKTLDVDLEYLLQKSGKEIFLKILLTELIKDKNITVEELSSKYPRYASFSINSQRTRLSKAKKIFELNKQKLTGEFEIDPEEDGENDEITGIVDEV